PNSFASARSATTRSKRENGGPKKGQSRRRGGARGGVGRSHHRGDAIRLAPAGVSATLGTIHLIAAGWFERLAADAYHLLTFHLSCVFWAPSCLVFGFLWSFLQSASDGVLQALNEAIVHAREPLERPSACNLVAGLTVSVSDLTVQMRRSTDRPATARGHTVSLTETTGRGLIRRVYRPGQGISQKRRSEAEPAVSRAR